MKSSPSKKKVFKYDWDEFLEKLRPFMFLMFPELRGNFKVYIEGTGYNNDTKAQFTIIFKKK